MPQILCKITSRGRPKQLLDCVDRALSLADDPRGLRWLFTFDVDDLLYGGFDFQRQLDLRVPDAVVNFGHSEYKVQALNRDLEKAQSWPWDILVTISDDQWAERKGWDTVIKNTMPRSLDASLWTFDGRQHRINTQEILGRRYYERFDYVYYPQYRSFFCDDEATCVARRLGKQIVLDEVLFRHYHYGWDKTYFAHDETYQRAEGHFQHDLMLYNERRAMGFGVPTASLPVAEPGSATGEWAMPHV